MAPEELFAALNEALPVKREIQVDGWPRSVWIWRLTLPQILELHEKFPNGLRDGEADQSAKLFLKLLAMCLGDANAPGSFATAAAQNWLERQPEALIQLGRAAMEFSELAGPSADRKKKSETTSNSEHCTTSAATSESDTLDD